MPWVGSCSIELKPSPDGSDWRWNSKEGQRPWRFPKINKNKESEKDGEAWLLSQAESNDLFERGREITFHLKGGGAPSVQFSSRENVTHLQDFCDASYSSKIKHEKKGAKIVHVLDLIFPFSRLQLMIDRRER